LDFMETNRQAGVPRASGLRNAVFVYLLIFVSGSQVFMLRNHVLLALVFLLILCSWALFSDRKINNRFVLYIIIVASLLFVMHLYTDGSLSRSTVISVPMKLILAYLILRIVGNNIVETYIKVVVFLAAISLFGYFTDTYRLFDGVISHLPKVGMSGHGGIFYVYRFREHMGRNNSIFYEPGAYQIFLNTALFMLFFVKTKFTVRTRWSFVLVLLAALLSTFSATGYLTLAATLFLVLTKSKMVSTQVKLALVGFVLVSMVVGAAKLQSVVMEKFDDYFAVQDITDNRDRRSFDLLVDLEIFKRHLFGVGHTKYFQEFSAIGFIQQGAASSNGVSQTLAIYGLPFSLFLFASYYWFFAISFNGVLMRVIPFGMLILFLVSESYYVFTPFCLAIIAAIFAYDHRGKPDEAVSDQSEMPSKGKGTVSDGNHSGTNDMP